MADRTEIAWCDSTFNPWIGCTKVGPGCDNCYAKADFDDRKHRVVWGAGQARSRTSPANWKKPLQWNRETFVQCNRCGWRGALASTGLTGACPGCQTADDYTAARRRVFCASLADVFDNEVDERWRDDLFALIEQTPNVDWLLLTKRIGNAARMLPWSACSEPWPNVWIGATIVNQEEADRDIQKLLATPAAVRFVSMEPLLAPVDVSRFMWPVHGWWTAPHNSYKAALSAGAECGLKRQALVSAACVFLDWVIGGFESGPHARPGHPDWARSLRDQCAPAGVPFVFKQWGEWLPCEIDCTQAVAEDGSGRELPATNFAVHTFEDGQQMARVGKKAAGRLLDGVEHNAFPEVSA